MFLIPLEIQPCAAWKSIGYPTVRPPCAGWSQEPHQSQDMSQEAELDYFTRSNVQSLSEVMLEE